MGISYHGLSARVLAGRTRLADWITAVQTTTTTLSGGAHEAGSQHHGELLTSVLTPETHADRVYRRARTNINKASCSRVLSPMSCVYRCP